MVAGRHNLTRRALLGACVGVPVLLGGRRAPAAAPPDRSRRAPVAAAPDRWHRALTGFRQAEARLAAFADGESRLPPAARAYPACEPLEERFNDLECARLAALRRLLRAPAPDLRSLSLKIDLAVDEAAWELTGAEPCLAAIKADARRLARAG